MPQKSFIKAFPPSQNLFEAPQGSVKIKIYINFYFSLIFCNLRLAMANVGSKIYQWCLTFIGQTFIHYFYTSMFPYPALMNKKDILQRTKKVYIGREGEKFD